ncbi:MAG: tetratricopeptide repeat protein [Gemmataceae bacterium]|nr:tetratricopeptide repeat protein [Gemmataceae bacterium]
MRTTDGKTMSRAARALFALLPSAALLTGCVGGIGSTQVGAAAQNSNTLRAKGEDDAKKPEAKKDNPKKDDEETNWKFWEKWFKADVPEGASETLILHGDRLEPEKSAAKSKTAAEMSGAHELYRLGEYDKARSVFHSIADNKCNPVSVAEEARFYEAECQYRMNKWPRACDTYHKTLLDFPNGAFREQCCQRMYDIAYAWLEDTRDEMRQVEQVKKGDRWMVVTPVCHFESTKPLIDEEGRAIETLERVRNNDPRGPLADKALFLGGSVKFFREDYREADFYFSQLVEMHPNSELATKAIELGIISKHLGTGGADYDGRKVAEARRLIDGALRSYPKLANDPVKREFLLNQLAACNMQQAEKDFRMAEFYGRTGHPGSAYFYYEIVRRRYPGTEFADKATQRMWDLRKELEKKAAKVEASAATQPKEPPAQPKPQPRPAAPVETAPVPRPVPPGGFAPPTETAPQPRPVMPGTYPTPPQPLPPPRSAEMGVSPASAPQ